MPEIKIDQLSPKSQKSFFGPLIVAEANVLAKNPIKAPISVLEQHARDKVAFGQYAGRLRKEIALDPLTGLLNRRAIMRVLDREMERAKRSGNTIQILFTDVRNFKNINDRFGHLQGDYALYLIAQGLKEKVRGYDIIGRYGGDENIVVLPDGDTHAANSLGTRFHQFIQQQSPPYDTMHVDMGVASFDPKTDGVLNSIDLIRRADQAMYYAKTRTLDYVVEWNPSMNGIVLPEDKK